MSSRNSLIGRVVALLWISLLLSADFSKPEASDLTLSPTDEQRELLRQLDAWIERDREQIQGLELRRWVRERSESFAMLRDLHERSETDRILSSLPYGPKIRRAAEEFSLDPLLLAAMVEVESGFNPKAVSYRGAVGLLQVMPSTAGAADEHLLDPANNLHAGARYLQKLLKRYEGDLELALAAYNAGPTNVRRYGGVPPFRETQSYVGKVLGRYVDHHHGVWRGRGSRGLYADSSGQDLEKVSPILPEHPPAAAHRRS